MVLKLASSRFWRAAAVLALILGVCPAAAEEEGSPGAGQGSPSAAKTKTDKKTKADKKTTETQTDGRSAKPANTKLKPGQFASEADAKDQCPGAVVWVGKDQLNHYEGSREYGAKPGAFACEP